MKNNPLADSLISIKNADYAMKKYCKCKPASKLLGQILNIMKKYEYIKDYKFESEKGGNAYVVELNRTINECRAVCPRYSIKKNMVERFERRYLPSKDIGIIIVSTSSGVFTHRELLQKNIGGKVIAYVY